MKHALRQRMCEQRQALSPALHAEKSAAIRRRLEELDVFKDAERLLIYVSLGNEVDTHALIHDALNKGRLVYVPKVVNGEIMICPLMNWEELEPGTFGILEPCTVLEGVPAEHMDLIIVPGLAFDSRGHRVGYGKGHYDRLLKTTKGYKVGLAFHEQMVDKVPTEDHDIPLDLIVTDETLIHP
jgi:5-formyltetrahydrofolate cyclo-ligase